MSIFHVSSEDLSMADLQNLMEILSDHNTQDVSWKHTNKVGEFDTLLCGSIEPGLDLVQIAQESSI